MWALKAYLAFAGLFDPKHPVLRLFFSSLMPKQMDLHQIRSWGICFQSYRNNTKENLSKLRGALFTGSLSAVCCKHKHFEKMKPQHRLVLLSNNPLVGAEAYLCVRMPHIHPFLLSPVAAELVIQPSSSRGPLCCQPAYASLHEAQWFLPSAHLLQQSPDIGLENSLGDRNNKNQWWVSPECRELCLISLCRLLCRSLTPENTIEQAGIHIYNLA